MSRTALSRTAPEAAGGGFVPGIFFMLKTVMIAYCISIALLFSVSVIATVHADSRETFLKSHLDFKNLFSCYITLNRSNGPGTIGEIYCD